MRRPRLSPRVYYLLEDGRVVSTRFFLGVSQDASIAKGAGRLLTRRERRRLVGALAWRVLGRRAPDQALIVFADDRTAAREAKKRQRRIWSRRPT